MSRVLAGVIGLALALALPAAADAQSPPLPDVPVAACPADATAAAFRVSAAAEGRWRLGPFTARLTADGLRVTADGRELLVVRAATGSSRRAPATPGSWTAAAASTASTRASRTAGAARA